MLYLVLETKKTRAYLVPDEVGQVYIFCEVDEIRRFASYRIFVYITHGSQVR